VFFLHRSNLLDECQSLFVLQLHQNIIDSSIHSSSTCTANIWRSRRTHHVGYGACQLESVFK